MVSRSASPHDQPLNSGNKHGLCDCGLVQDLLILPLFLQLSLPSFFLLVFFLPVPCFRLLALGCVGFKLVGL